MAVVEVKSANITNRDAVPRVLNSSHKVGGMVRAAADVVTVTSGNTLASIYRFFSVPSNARMIDLKLYSPDLGTTTIADFGLYQNTKNGGAVVDADFFASAVSLKDGALNGTDILHEAAVNTIANSGKAIWEALELSADPCVDYDVCATLTADADGTGVVGLKGLYAI